MSEGKLWEDISKNLDKVFQNGTGSILTIRKLTIKKLKLIINEKSGRRNRHLELLPSNLQKRICRRECFTERIGDRKKKKQRTRIGIESKRKREGASRKMRKAAATLKILKNFFRNDVKTVWKSKEKN